MVFSDPSIEKKVIDIQKLLVSDSSNVNLRIELARLFLEENMIVKAIMELQKAVEIAPNRVDSLLLLSYAYNQLLEPELSKSEILLRKALEIEPNNPDVHLSLAQVLEKLGKGDESIKEFNQAINFTDDPTILLSAHLGLMAAYKRKGDIVKADKEYQIAYKIYPGIKGIIEKGEIDSFTPPPQIPFGDEMHPSDQERIKLLLKEIEKLSGEKDEKSN